MSVETVVVLVAYVAAAVAVGLFFRHLPHGEREGDPPRTKQSLRFRLGVAVQRANPITAAFTVAVVVCSLPLVLVLVQQETIQSSRGEAIALVCDQNRIMRDFIREKPDYPRDAVALKALAQERCDELLREVERQTGKRYDRLSAGARRPR